MGFIVLGIYLLAMVGILLYCLLQLSLAIRYIRSRHRWHTSTAASPDDPSLPTVTIQLPLYNENQVAERLLRHIATLQYPAEKLQIQVLDDSTDDTTTLLKPLVDELSAAGTDIILLHRTDRTGFKAGALAAGLSTAKGELIAIFDADFMPPTDFLLRTVPFFADQQVGVVQTRWAHLNQPYNLLTRIQAFALDVHFSIEQTGRNMGGDFINFNGTAGIWRKSTIIDGGGWSADTLTEDLDLSYRAQMKGWQFIYLPLLESPAELPITMSGYKSQQFRWNKGGAETARKLLGQLSKAAIPGHAKLHGYAHLLNSSVYGCVWVAIMSSVPLLWVMNQYLSKDVYHYLSAFLLATMATAIVFFVGMMSTTSGRSAPHTFLRYLLLFPAFLSINLGMSLHNARAVWKGWRGKKTPFVRTPKFNITESKQRATYHPYLDFKLDTTTLLEGLSALYFGFGIWLGWHLADYGMMPLHLLAFIGFAFVFFQTIQEKWQQSARKS